MQEADTVVRVRAMVKMAASWWGEVSMLGEGSLLPASVGKLAAWFVL